MAEYFFHKIKLGAIGECIMVFKHGEIRNPILIFSPDEVEALIKVHKKGKR